MQSFILKITVIHLKVQNGIRYLNEEQMLQESEKNDIMKIGLSWVHFGVILGY